MSDVQPNANQRSRNWCFTLNNPTADEEQAISDLLSDAGRVQRHIRFAVIGRETGAMGTPHLQGFYVFEHALRLATIKNLPGMSRAHLECARGSIQQNVVYCSKEGNARTYGEVPSQGARSDLVRVAALVSEGKSLTEIAEESPVEFIKFSKGISALIALRQPSRTWKTEVYWYYGPTGTGKSRRAFEQAAEDSSYYVKDPSTKWWDGYDGQSTVIIDDYRTDFCTFSYLLRLLDRYPMRIEFKGGYTQFLARKIIITTPKEPRETWNLKSEEQLEQLVRRVDHIMHFANTIFNPSI